jgi:FAD/FMN-containing dehydrogenase
LGHQSDSSPCGWYDHQNKAATKVSFLRVNLRPRLTQSRKSSAGYNLTGLFVGSEGTLGLVTEVTLKLAVIPQETSVAVVTFPSMRDAAAAASQVMRAGVPVAAMEIMDEVQMYVVNKSGSTNRQWTEAPTLFFKYVTLSRVFGFFEDNADFPRFSGTKNGVCISPSI